MGEQAALCASTAIGARESFQKTRTLNLLAMTFVMPVINLYKGLGQCKRCKLLSGVLQVMGSSNSAFGVASSSSSSTSSSGENSMSTSSSSASCGGVSAGQHNTLAARNGSNAPPVSRAAEVLSYAVRCDTEVVAQSHACQVLLELLLTPAVLPGEVSERLDALES